MNALLATVLVPAKDEALWIDDCLASIEAQDYPHHLLEVIVVVDGASSDETVFRVQRVLASGDYARAELITTPGTGTPAVLNAGLALARGDVVCRVDARSRIPPHYVRRCVELLDQRLDVAVVGGAQIAVAPRDDAVGRGIARALNNRWSMGLSRYRRGGGSGTSDTVYLGAFRTSDLRAVGGWNRGLPTNQDFDLNRRLDEHGTVWFEESLPVSYVPRPTLRKLYQQYRRFGTWKVRYWRLTGDRPRPRQALLVVGVPVAAFVTCAALASGSWSRRALVAASAGGLLVFVEARGSKGPDGGLRAHGYGVLALGAVATGWLGGVWRELLR